MATEPSMLKTLSSVLMDRFRWAGAAGITFRGARDLYQILGYRRTLTYNDYRDRYARDGIAKAIVDAYPAATWRGGVELFEDENPDVDTEFEKAFKDLDQRLGFWQRLQQVDTLSGLSTFAVLLIGTGDADLTTELSKGSEVKFLKPFSGGGGPIGLNRSFGNRSTAFDAATSVSVYDLDPTSERYGEPEFYDIRSVGGNTQLVGKRVHWSRMIHCAEGTLEDDVYGIPVLESVWNLLDDLSKVTGGGSEAFWLRASQGLHVDVDKDLGLPNAQGQVTSAPMGTAERTEMRDKFEELQHQLQRVIVTRGTTVTQLGSDVAQFGPSVDSILKQIAGSKGIPMRILTGSEMGTLASEQDAANFDSRVQDRRTGYAGPKIVRRLVDRLIKYGMLPTPVKYEVGWPVEEEMTEGEKAKYGLDLANINKTQGEVVITNDEIREKTFKLKPLTPEQKQPIVAPVREQAQATENPDAKPGAPIANTPELKAALRALETAIENNDADAVARIIGLQDGPHKFSTTQVQLPDSFLVFGQTIPDGELDEQGREIDPHVTLKYGLLTNDVGEVRRVLAGRGPITFTLGKLNSFVGDGYDVLYVEVKSDDLRRLNALVSSRLDVNDSHYVYTPHATIAYLKPGMAAKYVGLDVFEGQQHMASSVTFSSADGERTVVPCSGM